ncbi:RodZ domain-containing protein [Pseudidiomarina sp. PP-1MA]|uniref:RodZ domain-containing protein n=1 Tax=Pseudidiomarina sp. PP-1MA TaxID=3237706 RepID=A0AB39XA34_9GAMM
MTNKQSKSNNSKPQTDDIFADEHKDANAGASTAPADAAQDSGPETGSEAGQEHSQETESQSSSEAAYSGETAGQILRAAREAKGLSEQQVADSLRLRLIVIKTIEADDFEKLGTATYVRGYLRSISKALDVDSAKVFAAYQAQGFGEAPAAELKMQSFSRRKVRERNDSRLMLISYIIIALVIAMAIAWWWQDSQNNDSDAQVEPRSEVTETNSPEGNARRATTVPLDTGSTTIGTNDASSGNAGSSTSGSNSDSNGGNTSDITSDYRGGSTGDSTGGTTGGTSGGNTSDITSDNSGGSTSNSTGGNTGGTSGGSTSDTTSDNSGGSTSDSTGGTNTDGTSGENTSDSTSGTTGSNTGSSGNTGSTTAGQDSLVLEFSQRCWVKVTEAGGNDIAIGVKEPGYRMPLTGNAPFDLILCKPEAVTITYNDAPVDLSNYRRNRSVTMTIE